MATEEMPRVHVPNAVLSGMVQSPWSDVGEPARSGVTQRGQPPALRVSAMQE